MFNCKTLLLCTLLTVLAGSWLPAPTHAAPPVQEGEDAILRIINESEETICYVLVCPPDAEEADDCPLATGTIIAPGETQVFDVTVGNYAMGLADCEGEVLLNEGGFVIADEYDLRFTGSTFAHSMSDCDVLFQQGNDLYQYSQFREALAQWEAALTCYREAGDRLMEGSALGNLGIAYEVLGQYETAIAYHKEALSIAREIGDRQVEVNALSNLGNPYVATGQYTIAIDYYGEALRIAREIGYRQSEEGCLGNLGSIYFLLGQYKKAIAYHEDALSIAYEIGNQWGEEDHLCNIGNVYSALGAYTTAMVYYEDALSIACEIGDRAGESADLTSLGIIYFLLGEYETAIAYYEDALNIVCEIDDRQMEGRVLNNLGLVYNELGQYETAIAYYEDALSISQMLGAREATGNHLGNLGNAYYALGQHETAIEYYEDALNVAREIGDRRGEETCLGNLGNAYDALGQDETAIEYHEHALNIAREIGDRQGEQVHLGNLGGIYLQLEQYERAIAYSNDALSIAREIDDQTGESADLVNLGIAYRLLGQYEEALRYYEQSIVVQEILRAELTIEDWKSSFTAMAESTVPYRGIIQVLLKLERPAEAFHYAQRAKARTFLDQIGNARVNPHATDDPALLEKEQALLVEIRELEAVLSGRQDFASLDTRGGSAPPLSTEQRAELNARLEQAYREYNQLLAQIQRTNPQYAALRTVQASTIITVQQTLPADVTLVEYYIVSSTQTLAFVVTREDFQAIPLSAPFQSISRTLGDFEVETQTDLEGIPRSMRTLYNLLFAPLREHIHTESLIIAPYDILHYVPFSALHDGEHYLVEDYVIGYIPSASVLGFLPTAAANSDTAFVFGNPANSEVSGLSGAEHEAVAIAELFNTTPYLGTDATEARLWNEVAGARYVHLAAHGEFNATAAQFSRIYLAPGGDTSAELSAERTDGLLETREVWNLPLEGVALVTLSACETQLGDLSAGDDLVGLSRAFLYAGTPSLVASLWSVEDESTAFLMERFYGYLKDGMGKAEALRQAQLDTMAEYPSPYHWAAFTLVGDMGEIPVSRFTPPRGWIGAGMGGIALVGVGLWLYKHRKRG